MEIPANVILMWAGTNAGIPAGWSRETDMDGRFVKVAGDGSDGGSTGGSSTHTHSSSSSHSHSIDSHTHTIYLGANSGYTTQHTGNNANGTVYNGHDHANFTSGGVASGGALSSESVTYAAFSNNPPYYEVIFIKSDGGQTIPDDAIGLWDESGEPSGFDKCDGNNGTPNLDEKYLRGAGTGANAGGTGGSTTNTHTLQHTHSCNSHTHSAATSGNANTTRKDSSGGTSVLDYRHKHTITLSGQDSVSSSNPSVECTETVEPAYKKLKAIQNTSGGSKILPAGFIALWLGTLTNIPRGWEIYDSLYGKHLKITKDDGEIGDTGGSNTHTHTNDSHTHSSTGHSHSHANVGHAGKNENDDNDSLDSTCEEVSGTHSVSSSSASPGYSNANTSAQSSNNEPEYREVVLIKYSRSTGGAFLLNMI